MILQLESRLPGTDVHITVGQASGRVALWVVRSGRAECICVLDPEHAATLQQYLNEALGLPV